MPLDDQRLVIEPSYPNVEALSAMGMKADEAAAEEYRDWSFVNQWYSRKWRCDIVLMRDPDGKIMHGRRPAFHHISHDLQTMGASDAWGLEQEHRALNLLGTLIRHRAMKQYVLTGMFLETSKLSGVTYLFRRLKPTVACVPDRRDPNASMRILASLCMHPIAYYADSWAGAMCPTDDVISHLMLMRADEHMFWKRANQHPPYRPEAGL